MQKKNFLKFKKYLLNNFIKIQGVESINLVGSFWSKPNSSNYSDIDIVIILDKFSLKKFNNCKNFVKNIDLNKYGLKEYKVKINSTFGPLKFRVKNNIVFHLMIYDLISHSAHVIKSPFTCLDWEKTKYYNGQSLGSILTPCKLQFKDFSSSRRGTSEYLKDITKNIITYREYVFQKNKIILKKKKFNIKGFEKKEFYYHISKNLIFNYYKLIKQKNKSPNRIQYNNLLKKIFKKNKSIINKFHLIFKSKHENLDLNIKDYSMWIKKFVKIFENHLFKEEKKYRKIFFIRHCKTLLNDNTFLGVRRDPYIKIDHNITKKINNFKKENIKLIYSSKLQRAIQTAKLFGLKNITTNTLLNEKDYGDAEGFDYLKLSRKFPHITEAWNKQKDLKFPNGENDKSVLMRVKKFKKILLKFLQKKKINGNIAIITHNVVLRCLIGDEFKIPKSLWYKISIEHLAKIEFIYYKGQMLPNINRDQLLGDLLK